MSADINSKISRKEQNNPSIGYNRTKKILGMIYIATDMEHPVSGSNKYSLMLLFFPIEHSLNDLTQTGVSADDEPQHAHDHNKTVPQDQPELLRALVLVPVGAHLEPRGERQAQGGETEGTEQRDEQLQIGDGDGEQD